MSRIAYVNGRYVPHGRAMVHIEDRGYQFADGVYEVCEVRGGHLVDERRHMQRLARSLGELRIAPPMPPSAIGVILREVVRRNRVGEGIVYAQVTRGVAARDHVMPPDIEPTVFIMASGMKHPTAEQRHQGVACITARDFRWERGDIKSVSLLGNVLARQMSADRGALETVMFRDGFLTEASGSNVWVVQEGALLGPPKSEHVLEGIRIELLRELCEEEGIAYNLRPIPEADVFAADEVLISSATKEVLPVTLLDGEPVGHGALRGKPGPVYARLHEAYQRAKATQSI